MSDGVRVRGIAQILFPLLSAPMSGAIKIGGDSRDAMPVRAVAGSATAYVNGSRLLRHELFGADLFSALIAFFIFRVLAGADVQQYCACADAQCQQISP